MGGALVALLARALLAPSPASPPVPSHRVGDADEEEDLGSPEGLLGSKRFQAGFFLGVVCGPLIDLLAYLRRRLRDALEALLLREPLDRPRGADPRRALPAGYT